jgi:hypothetical protein
MEFIFEVEDALPKEVCERIIQKYKNDDRSARGKVIGTPDEQRKGGTYTDVRKTSQLNFSHYEDWKDVKNLISDVFCDGLKKYKEYLSDYISPRLVIPMFDDVQLEYLFVQEQKPGDCYNWHLDDASRLHVSRKFTIMIYLNNLEDHQGGWTEFICGTKIKPKQGKMLIFPACWTCVHRGAPVKNSGVKYTVSTWAA